MSPLDMKEGVTQLLRHPGRKSGPSDSASRLGGKGKPLRLQRSLSCRHFFFFRNKKKSVVQVINGKYRPEDRVTHSDKGVERGETVLSTVRWLDDLITQLFQAHTKMVLKKKSL